MAGNKPQTRTLWYGLLVIATAAVTACPPDDVVPPPPPPVQGQGDDLRTPCPQHDSIWIPSRTSVIQYTRRAQLALPGTNTQIPEFHDCQRLIVGAAEYGPLAGIYAASDVGTSLETATALASAGDPNPAVGVATIVSQGPYPQLFIERGINCLYLYVTLVGGQPRPRAFMRSVNDGEDCAARLPADPAQNLNVQQEAEAAPFDKNDFSPSARWDWDPRVGQRKQFIGLPCGSAYCMYGHTSPQSIFRHDRPGMSVRQRRVWVIRTWYDEQVLGVPTASGMRPSTVIGTVFPDTGLGSRGEGDYNAAPGTNPWLLSAEIKLSEENQHYQAKFGLRATTDDSTNKVYLCKGNAARCLPAALPNPPACPTPTTDFWYAKIVAPNPGSTPVFRCVIRHVHPNFPIPGNARWWWDPQDEGIWMRCPQGCCQVT